MIISVEATERLLYKVVKDRKPKWLFFKPSEWISKKEIYSNSAQYIQLRYLICPTPDLSEWLDNLKKNIDLNLQHLILQGKVQLKRKGKTLYFKPTK